LIPFLCCFVYKAGVTPPVVFRVSVNAIRGYIRFLPSRTRTPILDVPHANVAPTLFARPASSCSAAVMEMFASLCSSSSGAASAGLFPAWSLLRPLLFFPEIHQKLAFSTNCLQDVWTEPFGALPSQNLSAFFYGHIFPNYVNFYFIQDVCDSFPVAVDLA